MSVGVRPLIEVFEDMPDSRQRQGQRHPLPAILALACAATLCGYRSYGAMAQWGRNYSHDLAVALGFAQGRTPCAATFYNVFKGVDCAALEAVLGQWAQSVVAVAQVGQTGLPALAMDGKSLRGSRGQGASEAHLLSVVSHVLGLTVLQMAVGDKTNEITAAQEVLKQLVLEGQVVTVDALLTQREIAQQIVQKGGTT